MQFAIRAGEKEIYVYNLNGDHIRTHNRSYTPKDWVIIPSDIFLHFSHPPDFPQLLLPDFHYVH